MDKGNAKGRSPPSRDKGVVKYGKSIRAPVVIWAKKSAGSAVSRSGGRARRCQGLQALAAVFYDAHIFY